MNYARTPDGMMDRAHALTPEQRAEVYARGFAYLARVLSACSAARGQTVAVGTPEDFETLYDACALACWDDAEAWPDHPGGAQPLMDLCDALGLDTGDATNNPPEWTLAPRTLVPTQGGA